MEADLQQSWVLKLSGQPSSGLVNVLFMKFIEDSPKIFWLSFDSALSMLCLFGLSQG